MCEDEEALRIIGELLYVAANGPEPEYDTRHWSDYAALVADRAEAFLKRHGIEPDLSVEPPELAEMNRKDEEARRRHELAKAEEEVAVAQRRLKYLQDGGR